MYVVCSHISKDFHFSLRGAEYKFRLQSPGEEAGYRVVREQVWSRLAAGLGRADSQAVCQPHAGGAVLCARPLGGMWVCRGRPAGRGVSRQGPSDLSEGLA